MIEHIKYFPPKFDQLTFGYVRSLDHRDVCVVKARADYYVSSEVSESSDRHSKRRDVEPTIRRSKDRNRTSHVWTQSIVDAVNVVLLTTMFTGFPVCD